MWLFPRRVRQYEVQTICTDHKNLGMLKSGVAHSMDLHTSKKTHKQCSTRSSCSLPFYPCIWTWKAPGCTLGDGCYTSHQPFGANAPHLKRQAIYTLQPCVNSSHHSSWLQVEPLVLLHQCQQMTIELQDHPSHQQQQQQQAKNPQHHTYHSIYTYHTFCSFQQLMLSLYSPFSRLLISIAAALFHSTIEALRG